MLDGVSKSTPKHIHQNPEDTYNNSLNSLRENSSSFDPYFQAQKDLDNHLQNTLEDRTRRYDAGTQLDEYNADNDE